MQKILLKKVLLTIILATTSQTLLCDDTKVVNTEINCLAKAVYHEARGEPREGQLAIAKTVLNRVSDPKFPKSVCKVVYQPHQFTNIRRLVIKDTKAWDNALAIAHTVTNMEGKYSFKAKYFHSNRVSPGWKKKPVARIGNHIFYT